MWRMVSSSSRISRSANRSSRRRQFQVQELANLQSARELVQQARVAALEQILDDHIVIKAVFHSASLIHCRTGNLTCALYSPGLSPVA